MLVLQALRGHRTSKKQIEAFVAELRAGAARLTDDAAQGRDASLAASLDYGFAEAFTETERAQLALLSLFQGFVSLPALLLMGQARVDDPVLAVRGLDPATGKALLDRAAEAGLLSAHFGGSYAVHPAVPWHLRDLFELHYGPPGSRLAMSRRPCLDGVYQRHRRLLP